jgi:hypothetical protein
MHFFRLVIEKGERASIRRLSMKIAIDGFALAVGDGTGVTRYAFELAQTLVQAQHQVFPVYGRIESTAFQSCFGRASSNP